jgi:glyoxylase-like metal-dependent hydrolase (beta-lactamase superfamily II)
MAPGPERSGGGVRAGEQNMYELIQAGEHTYYVESPSKVGIWVPDGKEAWLIDSGNDKDMGKRLLKLLDSNGWELKAVLNTHSHADHTGGNRILQERTGCRVYGNGMECAFANYPVLKPSFLYGGYPPDPLRNKFLMGTSSAMEQLTEAVLPPGIRTVPLRGHFFDMTGFATADGVIFLADSVISEKVLGKYSLSFLIDVQAYLDTLDRIENLEGSLFIPSHAEAAADIRPLVRANREKVQENIARILELCRTPKSFEDILAGLFEAFGLALDWGQYALAGCTLRSYLSYLFDSEKVKSHFEKSRLLWTAAQ